MFEQDYDNTSYWRDIHQDYAGTLRAVGWPTLSEAFNRLKYGSEAEAFVSVLESIEVKERVELLEVGVGIGFWTSIEQRYFSERGSRHGITAVDISRDALALVQQKFPDVAVLEADLKTVALDSQAGRYDLVTAIMVLLHLTDAEAYQHALKFCARSVRDEGYLLVYEPLIYKNYTPFGSQAFDSTGDNSVPRPLSLVDNILHNEGFVRAVIQPGASWLLNSPIQANSGFGFRLQRFVWHAFVGFVFRSERLTQIMAPALVVLDKWLKARHGNSGTFVLYRKCRQGGA